MKKFFKSLLALILVVIIAGGLGYIGYSYYFMNPFSMSSAHGTVDTSNQSSDQSMQGMQMGDMNGQMQTYNNVALDTINMAMSNKESLDTAMASLNQAIAYMTLDPYAPVEKTNQTGAMGSSTGGMQMPQQTSPVTGVTNPDGTTNPAQSSTIINIYPQTESSAANVKIADISMSDMGTVYDANKMEQLHGGLYKLSIGMQLLEQLNDDLVLQAELASTEIQNPIQYYKNQYSLMLQNKNKLNKALTNINEAANLVNINPYVSEKGLIYDKTRMQKIHESIFKMAQGVSTLSKLDGEMTNQAVVIANTVQNYINNTNMYNSMNMNSNTTSGAFGGIFDNINVSTIVNVILIFFGTMFILGLFGFIFSLLKTPSKNQNNNLNTGN